MSELLSEDDQDKCLAEIEYYIEEHPSRDIVKFLEDVKYQIIDKRFLTMKQFEALKNIMPERITWIPEIINEGRG